MLFCKSLFQRDRGTSSLRQHHRFVSLPQNSFSLLINLSFPNQPGLRVARGALDHPRERREVRVHPEICCGRDVMLRPYRNSGTNPTRDLLLVLSSSSPRRDRRSLAGLAPQAEKLSSSLFCRCNLLQQKAITANGSKASPPRLDLPCHVPLSSNSALIPALKYIMKDIQNISKWHWY